MDGSRVMTYECFAFRSLVLRWLGRASGSCTTTRFQQAALWGMRGPWQSVFFKKSSASCTESYLMGLLLFHLYFSTTGATFAVVGLGPFLLGFSGRSLSPLTAAHAGTDIQILFVGLLLGVSLIFAIECISVIIQVRFCALLCFVAFFSCLSCINEDACAASKLGVKIVRLKP